MIPGEAARLARERAAMTMKELSLISGVCVNTIKSFEVGYRGTTLSTAIALADALGISLDEYVGRSI